MNIVIEDGTTLIIPAFYRATQHFKGIKIAKECAASLTSIKRAPRANSLSAGFTAVLRSNWPLYPMYESFGAFWPYSVQ
jgi:hypothetical protein